MNIFNRVIMIVAMLFLIVFSIVTIINIFMNLFEWSTISDRIINYTTNLNPYILTIFIFLILVTALIILVFEFYRRKINLADISTDTSGKTMVLLSTASKQIRESLNNIRDMIDLRVNLAPGQDGIIINTCSKLAKGVNIEYKTKEIREAASNFASKDLGFKVLQTNYTLTGFVTKKIKKGVEKGIITINKIGLTKSGQAIFTLSGPGGPHATINLNYVGSGKWENLPFGSYTIIEAWPNGNVYKYKTKLSASTEEINATNRYPIIEVINADKIPEDIKNDKEA